MLFFLFVQKTWIEVRLKAEIVHFSKQEKKSRGVFMKIGPKFPKISLKMVTDSRWNERIFEKQITNFYTKFQKDAPFVLTIKKAWIEVRLKAEIVYFSNQIKKIFSSGVFMKIGPQNFRKCQEFKEISCNFLENFGPIFQKTCAWKNCFLFWKVHDLRLQTHFNPCRLCQ